MYTEPIILPLDPEGKIYALQDTNGNTIATGTRAACEVLMFVMTRPNSSTRADQSRSDFRQRPNVRAAIKI
jgi:hypothetical protein